MKCILFGGGGFIGSAIVDRLLLDGHTVRIFELPGKVPYRDFKNNESVEWVTGEFNNIDDVSNALEDMDIVLHLISTTLPKTSNDDILFDIQSNLVATIQLLNAMVTKKVERIIFISSGGTVYGLPVNLPITELHPTNPLVSYGITKLSIEKYLYLYHRCNGIKPTILRVANAFGERQLVTTKQGSASVFLHRALQKKPIDIWGDGTITRDYIYIRDIADAFARAIQYRGNQLLFNIGSGVGTSVNDLVSQIEEIVGYPIVRRYHSARDFDVLANVLDNSLAKKELSWEPKTSFRDGLINTARWLEKQILDAN